MLYWPKNNDTSDTISVYTWFPISIAFTMVALSQTPVHIHKFSTVQQLNQNISDVGAATFC